MKRIVRVTLLTAALLLIFTLPALAYQIYNNGLNGLYIDINNAPFNESWSITPYGTTSCTWYAQARVKQLTGLNSNGIVYGCDQWYKRYGAQCGYSTGTALRRDCKSLICWGSPHIAVVEGFTTDGKIIISEGGTSSFWNGSETIYMGGNYGNCVIRVFDSQSALENKNSDFLGYVYLPVAPSLSGGIDMGTFDGYLIANVPWKPLVVNEAGNNLELDADNSEQYTAREAWHFARQSDGSYIITSLYNGYALDVYNGNSASGTNVGLYTQWGDDNSAQRFYLAEGLKVVPKCAPGTCLDVTSGSFVDGVNIEIWEQNGTDAQKIWPYDIKNDTTDVFPTGMTVADSLTVAAGGTAQISYSFSPANAMKNRQGIVWTSSDASVATVDANGVVTGVNSGTATITAISKFNDHWTAECKVTVESSIPAPVLTEFEYNGNALHIAWTESPLMGADDRRVYQIELCDVFEPHDVYYTSDEIDGTVADIDLSGVPHKTMYVNVYAVNANNGERRMATSNKMITYWGEPEPPKTLTLSDGEELSWEDWLDMFDDTSKQDIRNNAMRYQMTSSDPEVLEVVADMTITGYGRKTLAAHKPGTVTLTCGFSEHSNTFRDTVVTVLPSANTVMTLPEALQAIDDEAFAGTSLVNIAIPDACKTIGRRAFAESASLRVVYIPATVTEIDPTAFEGCSDVLTIRGAAGSAAEAFALRQGIAFIEAE